MPKKFTHPFLDELHTCFLCGARLEVSTNGRPRKFCSDAHRKTHNKKNSVKNIIKHYNVITKEFFSTANSDDRQKQLVKWGREYALWCNGEHPAFAKTKDALLNVNIPRPLIEKESGKNIHVRMIAYLRTMGIEDQKIYDRLAVVKAFDISPINPELLQEPASNVIPVEFETPKVITSKPVVIETPVTIEPAIVIKTPVIAEPANEEEFLFPDSAFADDESEIVAKPKPVAQTRIKSNIIASLGELAKSKDRSNDSLLKIIKGFTCSDNDDLHIECILAMVDSEEVERYEVESGEWYYRKANTVPTQVDHECVFYHSGLKFLNERNSNKDNTKTMNNHFKAKFGHFASNEVKNTRPVKLDSGEASAFIKQKLADFAKSRQAA